MLWGDWGLVSCGRRDRERGVFLHFGQKLFKFSVFAQMSLSLEVFDLLTKS